MNITRVTAFDRAELTPYATLRQHEEHKRAGLFVAEGDKVVRRLLESTFGVVSVLLPEKRLAEFEPLVRARPEEVTVYVMELAELEKLTGFPFFQGVLAVGRIPPPLTLRQIVERLPRPCLLVAMDGMTNAENVGLIVRNAAAFGAHALLYDGTSASPFLRRAVRNSMGTIFKLPVVEVDQLAGALRQLHPLGLRVLAADAHAQQRQISEADFRGDCCLVFGSEGSGISKDAVEACHERIVVPMRNEVDSLNVGSAAAVFLYEAARQRAASGVGGK